MIVPDDTRFSGHWIVAAQGMGKTTLLHTMIMDDLKKDACVILIDAKGELTRPIQNLKTIQDRLLLIDPRYPIAINPLDIPKDDISDAATQLEYMFGALLKSTITAKQSALFRSILRAVLIAYPFPTLTIFQDILTTGGVEKSLISKLPQDLQNFFTVEFETYNATRLELLWRLRYIMERDIVRTMFNAPKTEVHIKQAMDDGKVIIVNNSEAILGSEGSEFLGRFIVAQIWAAATARQLLPPTATRKPAYIYIDEADIVISKDNKIASIIDRCRSQKIALILAHQRIQQIDDSNVLSALSNCAIKYANVEPDDAKLMAPKLRTETDKLLDLPTGTFAAHIRGVTKQCVAFHVTPVDFSKYETSLSERTVSAAPSAPAAQPEPPENTGDDAHTTPAVKRKKRKS